MLSKVTILFLRFIHVVTWLTIVYSFSLLCIIWPSEYTTVYPVSSWWNTWVNSSFWFYKLCIYEYSYACIRFLKETYLEVELLGCCILKCSLRQDNANCFPKCWVYKFIHPSLMGQSPTDSWCCLSWYCQISDFCQSRGYKVESHCDHNLPFP